MKESRADKITTGQKTTTNQEEGSTGRQSESKQQETGENKKMTSSPTKSASNEEPACEDISISVSTEFLPEQSETAKSLFAFSYTVRIVNEGKMTVQLLNRHWRVFSGGRQIADVKGEGVVGEQPILQPGEAFEYESGTLLHDPIGHMSGSYTFVDEYGTFFDIPIEEFSFIHMDDLTVH